MKYVFKLNNRNIIVTEEILSTMQSVYQKEIKVEHVDKRVRLTAAKWLVKTFVDNQIHTSGEINWDKAAEEALERVIVDAIWKFCDTLEELDDMIRSFKKHGIPAEVIKLLEEREYCIAACYIHILHNHYYRPGKMEALLTSLDSLGDAEFRAYAAGRGDQHRANGDRYYNALECLTHISPEELL